MDTPTLPTAIDAMDTKAFKRNLNNSDNYHRRGFGQINEAIDRKSVV